jgi:hypothetical protein
MVYVQSLIFVLLASQAAIAAAVAGERTTLREPAAVSAQTDSGQHVTKDARTRAATPFERAATAVDGAESSHGKDIGMWRPDPSGPQGPMQVSEAAATDVGGGNRFDLTQNRAIGRAYLAQLYGRYRNWPDTIAAYNWGLGKMDAWIKGGRPPEKFQVGVANYLRRVLHDSGLCDATEPKRQQQSPGFADRSNAREPGPDALTRSICAHRNSGRSSKDLDKAVMVALELSAEPPRSQFEGEAGSARASWGSAMRFFGCTTTSGNFLQCR